MKTWRESRVLLIVAGLGVLAVVPAVLTVMGVTNAWALSSATVVAAVVAAAVVVWQERYKWVAQRRDDLGRLEEAEAEHRAVLEIRRRVSGEEHPDTLDSRNNLALVLGDLGRLEEAEAEHRAVLEIRRRVLGEEHPDTLTSRNNLASVLNGLGRLEEAEAEHQTVLEIHRPGVG